MVKANDHLKIASTCQSSKFQIRFNQAVLRMIWIPESVYTGSLSSPTSKVYLV